MDARDRLLELMEITLQRDRERDAAGWVVLTVDLTDDSPVSTVGIFDTPEAALIKAGEMDVESAGMLEIGEPGWKHHVLPMWAA